MRRTCVCSACFLVWGLWVFVTSPCSAAGASQEPASPRRISLDVPLTIYELAGVERRQDICSTGVPLPCGLLKEPEGIAVFDASGGAVSAQFRVLERWRDQAEGKADRSVRWLLVTFLADVPAGGKSVYYLKAGRNPPPAEPVTPEDKGDVWEMGGLRIKKDFSSPFALTLTALDDKKVTAADLPIRWSVWESGPLRACLKAESPTVPRKFGFIAWVYAYAGQKRWDVTVVLKNTPNERRGPLYFNDFSVVWKPAETRGGNDFLLGGQWGKAIAGKLDGGQTVYLHQESDGTDEWNTFGKDWRMSPVLDWTADQVYGMADFILEESSLGQWGFNYVVLIDPAKNKAFRAVKRTEADKDGKHVSYGDLAWVLAWVYDHYGDQRFRTMIEAINPKAYPYVPRGYTGYYPERSDKSAPEAIKDLTAEVMGGGRIRLSWSAPAGEPVRYQVKWADKPMVERLKWPDEKDIKTNWWAANPVTGEPRPGGAGSRESMVVEGVRSGERYFAIRSFDAASNRSAASNMIEVEVR